MHVNGDRWSFSPGYVALWPWLCSDICIALPRATTAEPVLQKTVSIDGEPRPQPPIRMQQLVQQCSRKMPPCWSDSKLVRNWSFETRLYQHNELRGVKQILIETEQGKKIKNKKSILTFYPGLWL